MSRSSLAAGIRGLRRKLATQARSEDSDEQLLHAFCTRRDDSAFILVNKAKIATALLLAISMLGGTGVWVYRGLAGSLLAPSAPPAEPPGSKVDEKSKASPPKHEAAKSVAIQGRVLGARYPLQPAGADGRFRLVTIPGPVLLMGGADDPDPFKRSVPDPKYPEYFTKEPGLLCYYNPGGSMSPVHGNFCKVLRIKPDAKLVQQDIVLERAAVLLVRIQDADGKPLRNVWVGGSTPQRRYSAVSCGKSECPVYEMEAGKPRLLAFIHPARKLAGTLTLKGEEKTPIAAKLAPAASIKGRLLDEEGKPLAGVVVHANYHQQAASEVYNALHGGVNQVATSADGGFAFDDVIPQQKFELSFRRGKRKFERVVKPTDPAILVGAGQCRDVGAIKVKPESDGK